ncbi:MAG: YibE/F family protein, partial [Pseudarthrobacter sp.]
MAARRKANRILAAVLIPLTLLTLAGMAMLWPSGSKEGISLANPYSAAPGVTFDTGTIQSVVTENCMQGIAQQGQGEPGQGDQAQTQQGQQSQQGSDCTFAYTEPDKGGSPVKVVINPDVAKSHGVKPGDQIRYLNLSNAQ